MCSSGFVSPVKAALEAAARTFMSVSSSFPLRREVVRTNISIWAGVKFATSENENPFATRYSTAMRRLPGS